MPYFAGAGQRAGTPSRYDEPTFSPSRFRIAARRIAIQLPTEHWHDYIGGHPWQTPFLTGCCTVRTALNCAVNRCENLPPA